MKASITAAFTNLNKETVGKASRRIQSRLEAVAEVSGVGWLEFMEYQPL